MVALAASAGGICALSVPLSALPADFPAPVLIAQHISPEPRSRLAACLSRHTTLHVREIRQGDHIQAGRVYVTPSGRHIHLCKDGTLLLTPAENVCFGPPSTDLLFKSLAAGVGARAIAIVLTGTGSDGSRGVRAVRAAGGVVIAQDGPSSRFTGMPLSAVETGCVDLVLPLSEIGSALVRLLEDATDKMKEAIT